MNLKFYAVRDALAGSFMNPVPMPNDECAERALKQAANEPESFKENKKDIQLWYLYEFDTTTGLVTNNEPHIIGNLIDYVEVKKDE